MEVELASYSLFCCCCYGVTLLAITSLLGRPKKLYEVVYADFLVIYAAKVDLIC